jgi:glycosyltransferase involved in cell wall biosynthesis
MRIAQVVLSLGIGGQERLVVRLVTSLRERGHDVHVVALSRGGALRDELAGTPIHDVPFRGAEMEAFGFDPTLAGRLWRLFRSLRLDVVHTHNGPPLVYGAPAGRIARARVVHTKHGNPKVSGRSRPLTQLSTRFVHHFVAVSNETAEVALKNERPRRENLAVIENGIPLDAFGPDEAARASIRDELGIPRDALVVGSVGRLVGEKDYPLLVRAMTPLLSERIRLVLVGEGKARAEIEAAIGPKERPFVVLTGARRDVPKVLCTFDVFAMSSRTEGLPLALPEAMTSQLPVVATAVGGVPSVVPQQAGFLVPHGNETELKRAIERLLEDATLRSRMGKDAREYALGRFSEARMLDEYLALYTRRR